jgi:hypothetical protein
MRFTPVWFIAGGATVFGLESAVSWATAKGSAVA